MLELAQYSSINDFGNRAITEKDFLHAISHWRNHAKRDKPMYCYPRYDEYVHSTEAKRRVEGDNPDGDASLRNRMRVHS